MGDRLAELRLRRNLTRERLAECAGLSVDVIRKLEQGRRNSPRLSTVNALASALDTEPSYLVGQPTTFEAHHDRADRLPSVLALREAVSPVADLLGGDADPEDPPTIGELRTSPRSTQAPETTKRLDRSKPIEALSSRSEGVSPHSRW